MKKFFSIRYILGRIWIAFLQGKKVKTGPFKGIILKRNINLNLFYSKLLGIYEKELHSILNDVLKKNFKQNISQNIMNRFISSHSKTKIEARIPKHSDIPFLPSLISHFLRHTILGTITERPIGMHWLH
jgi:hypothetical protein